MLVEQEWGGGSLWFLSVNIETPSLSKIVRDDYWMLESANSPLFTEIFDEETWRLLGLRLRPTEECIHQPPMGYQSLEGVILLNLGIGKYLLGNGAPSKIKVSWASFKESILRKYFPVSSKNQSEFEFLYLYQGAMSSSKNQSEFEFLYLYQGAMSVDKYITHLTLVVSSLDHQLDVSSAMVRTMLFNKLGHILRDCITLSRPRPIDSTTRSVKPTTVRCVFAMSGAETSKSNNIISNECDSWKSPICII
ncbi:hypothetical protein CR513_42307, partial [Mucuna pruriens]